MNDQMTRRLTLKDVAARLNVSIATISNAFNRPDQLSAELRANILEECEKLGYFGPNAAARSLRTGRTGIVGVVLTDKLSFSVSDAVASQFLQGVAEVLDSAEYNMLLLSIHDQAMQHRMQSSMVDGFIIYGHKPALLENAPWLSQQKHTVEVDSFATNGASVNVDNFQGAKDIANHALRHKPNRVAILGLALLNTDRVCRTLEGESFENAADISIRRLRGYFAAMEKHGYEVEAENIWNIPINEHRLAYQAAREALQMVNRPQLFLCMSDVIAIATVQAALHLGLRVPEDMHVVGFDGIAESANLHPSITTVHQQTVEKGRIAAELFLGQREAKSVVLKTELIVGESCP